MTDSTTREDAAEAQAALTRNVEGHEVGAGVSIIRESTDVEGSGPRLHSHPYRETFVIQRGRALFTIGDEQREGRAGDVLAVPAGVPHKFAVLGPGRYEAVHIHENDRFVTEWLE
ncbi:cupin domain-containing protein [Amycolatopsis sp. NPDC051903]|uniref:cupin domain-containing protein n=1 Tax=Amycolatopsis sp. NPDC051903 TaxID=3363936 RepID=UPI0037A9E1C2